MQDGSLVTWDQSTHGANSSAVQAQLAGVQSVCATREAFAALKAADGSVVTWGDPSMGGDSSSSTVGAFAAVTQSGRVVTWGSDADGGNSSSVAHKLTNVEFAYPTWHALAAKTSNSSLVTRGDPAAGGGLSFFLPGSAMRRWRALSASLLLCAACSGPAQVVTRASWQMPSPRESQMTLALCQRPP